MLPTTASGDFILWGSAFRRGELVRHRLGETEFLCFLIRVRLSLPVISFLCRSLLFVIGEVNPSELLCASGAVLSAGSGMGPTALDEQAASWMQNENKRCRALHLLGLHLFCFQIYFFVTWVCRRIGESAPISACSRSRRVALELSARLLGSCQSYGGCNIGRLTTR